jgi:hypothetical protein
MRFLASYAKTAIFPEKNEQIHSGDEIRPNGLIVRNGSEAYFKVKNCPISICKKRRENGLLPRKTLRAKRPCGNPG